MSRDTFPAASDPAPRRALLRISPNPEPSLDYLVTLSAPLSSGETVEIRYVPDRDILIPEALPAYLASAALMGAPESIAALVLGDILNEALPRWVRVTLVPPPRHGVTHSVVMEDRRPGWDNPALLARMAPL